MDELAMQLVAGGVIAALVALGVGIVFEWPVAVLVLVRLGLLRTETLERSRPYAVIAAFALAAVLTPPDVVTQIMLGLPLVLLYELSILGARWQMHRQPAAATTAPGGEGEEDAPRTSTDGGEP